MLNDCHRERARNTARQLQGSAAGLSHCDARVAMARHIRDEVGVAAILVHNAGIPDGGAGPVRCFCSRPSPKGTRCRWTP
ncbi:hypothetical protein [uncultured Comamonas sp.]|uniref:hypothetical protein n=1 Tax=uncultured Comamonas sp. TaxID=114710 RepID=UPI0025D4029B|nr:hypothetical protein [uncultured Comamonas sp.]